MNETVSTRWSAEKAWDWSRRLPWLCGFNYLPSTAVNSTEMWQSETFDPDTIKRELEWAQQIGLNCCHIFVQALVWDADPDGLADRLDQCMGIAQAHGMATLPILFDDCAFAGREPSLGPHPSSASTTAGGRQALDRRRRTTPPPGPTCGSMSQASSRISGRMSASWGGTSTMSRVTRGEGRAACPCSGRRLSGRGK